MTEPRFSQQLYRSILVHSTVSIVTVGLLVAVAGSTMFYFRIKSEMVANLEHALRIRSMTVDEYLKRVGDIARQITSRSKLRQKLEQYNRGEATNEELVAFAAPLLSDAMNQSQEIAGITRLDADGRLAVTIGMKIPAVEWPIPGGGEERVRLRGPLRLGAKTYLVLGAAILAEGERRVGTDIILFEIRKLQEIISDTSGLGDRGEVILGIEDHAAIRLLVPLRGEAREGAPQLSFVLAPDTAKTVALAAACAGRGGVLESNGQGILAYGPLLNRGWGLAVSMDKAELYAPLYREMLISAVLTVLLIGAGCLVMVVALRPLTRSILIKAEDLEKEISDKTAQLAATAEALRVEKGLLIVKNGELAKAYGDLQAAQAQILHQEKMASIGQLAAGIAHEINNPLGFMISNLNTLGKYLSRFSEFMGVQGEALEGQGGNPELLAMVGAERRRLKIDLISEDASGLLQESLAGAERVRDIVQDLRNFSRFDEAAWQEADINTGLESTINLIHNELATKAVAVTRVYGEIPLVRCNLRDLNQAFMNILLNGVQAVEREGEISVCTWANEQTIFITFSDNGVGIPAENIGRIFDPFFTTKPVGSGKGLGLNIAYAIVKQHRGEISVSSELGRGTTFRISIPHGLSAGEPESSCP